MRLTQQQLEAHLWGADNTLRGKTAGKDCKNYILSRRVNIMKMAHLISEQGLRSEGASYGKLLNSDLH